jgi:hypothetical protein
MGVSGKLKKYRVAGRNIVIGVRAVEMQGFSLIFYDFNQYNKFC